MAFLKTRSARFVILPRNDRKCAQFTILLRNDTRSARFIILLRNGKQRFEIVKKIAVNIVNIKFAYRFII